MMRSSRAIVLLLALINFANILDFMMVMPLGPDLAVGLGIPASQIGLLGAAYTGAAALAGLVCSTFLDRLDRRTALTLLMVGLGLGTFGGALAWDFSSLLATRLLAGAFGGPATAAAYSIIADVIPRERRGQAMAAVMGAFALASVLGVPIGLRVAGALGWRAPFIGVGLLGVLLAGAGWVLLPPMRGHLESGRPAAAPLRFTREALAAFAAVGMNHFASFTVLPNLSTWLLFNANWPREHLDLLYMVGGAASFAVMRLAGRATDRFGAPVVSAFGASVAGGVMLAAFLPDRTWIHPIAFFVLLMSANSCRSVSAQALMSQVPDPAERARFNALLSAVQHIAAAGGAAFGSVVLSEGAGHRLLGMDDLSLVSMPLFLVVPILFAMLDRSIAGRSLEAKIAA